MKILFPNSNWELSDHGKRVLTTKPVGAQFSLLRIAPTSTGTYRAISRVYSGNTSQGNQPKAIKSNQYWSSKYKTTSK